MAKFRDSKVDAAAIEEAVFNAGNAPPAPIIENEDTRVRSIGDILTELRSLSAEQVERVLAHQRSAGIRFGEAAVALGLASNDDVLFALSRQFHYPYAPEEMRKLSPELVALNEPFGARAEHFRALRSQLMMRVFSGADPRRMALAVISPESGDGKTYCAANLAVVLAQLGGRTLLVDANLRGPRVHELFRLDNRTGLSGILSGRADKGVIQQVASVPSLFLLPVGTTPPNPLELIERQAFGVLMKELCSKFDHVVVDTPAAVHGSDSSVVAARCGAALVVARRNASRVALLQDLVGGLEGTGSLVAGIVLNEH